MKSIARLKREGKKEEEDAELLGNCFAGRSQSVVLSAERNKKISSIRSPHLPLSSFLWVFTSQTHNNNPSVCSFCVLLFFLSSSSTSFGPLCLSFFPLSSSMSCSFIGRWVFSSLSPSSILIDVSTVESSYKTSRVWRTERVCVQHTYTYRFTGQKIASNFHDKTIHNWQKGTMQRL